MISMIREQPPAFRMIFMLELWERFGFYSVQGILILFFMRFLGISDNEAYYIFGSFTAILYGMMIFGGYLGDQIIGTKRTIVLGLLVLIAGYFSLALATQNQVYYALALISVGNGIFKANPSNLLSKCYEPGDLRLHSGFTLYYMAINLGSTVALIIGPYVAHVYGYSATYYLSAAGLCLGLANYWFQRKLVAHINTDADKRVILFWQWALLMLVVTMLVWISAWLLQHIQVTQWLLFFVIAIALVRYFMFMHAETKMVRVKMIVALVLMVEAVVFFSLYQQMPSSLNLFAVNNVVSQLFGVHFDPQSFQALNPIWIIVMSPLLAMFYGQLNKRNVAFTITYKFAMGMTLSGLSFLLLYFARFYATDQGMVSAWWLVASYLFQSLGELLVSALGIAMVAELVPAQIVGFVMGMWFLASALAGYTGAFVASFTAIPSHVTVGVESLHIYTHVFASIGLVTLSLSLLMWMIAPWLNRFMQNRKYA
jgi:POT family proton-dependent oligopeptide transporter